MKITVVGLGELGLPLALQFARSGHEVIGADAKKALVHGPAVPLPVAGRRGFNWHILARAGFVAAAQGDWV